MTKQAICVLLWMLLVTPSFILGAGNNDVEESLVFKGKLEEYDAFHKVIIPEEFSGVDIRLEIQSSADLDLDVYEADPREKIKEPVCVSDGIDKVEVCRLRRPETGVVWARVVAVEKQKKAPGQEGIEYELFSKWITSEKAEVAFAKRLRPGVEGMPIANEGLTGRFEIAAGNNAVVILEGQDRDFSVERISNDETVESYPVHESPRGMKYVALGEPVQSSTVLLSSFDDHAAFFIKVGAIDNPYAQARSWLTIRGGNRTEGPSREYMLPFSPEQVEKKPIVIKPRVVKRLGELKKGELVVYRIEGHDAFLAGIFSMADVAVAVCDQFGIVADVDSHELFIADRDTFARPKLSTDLYLVVFPNPFQKEEQEGKFEINIRLGRALQKH